MDDQRENPAAAVTAVGANGGVRGNEAPYIQPLAQAQDASRGSAAFETVIEKNAREEVRISLETFKGHDLVNLRVWFRAEDGSMRPGKAGLTLRVDKLKQLIEALQRAAEHARAAAGEVRS
jgi:hypothetical protein